RTDRRRRGPVPPGAVPEPVVLVPTPAVHLAVGAFSAAVIDADGEVGEGHAGRRADLERQDPLERRTVTDLPAPVAPPAVDRSRHAAGAGVEASGFRTDELDAVR